MIEQCPFIGPHVTGQKCAEFLTNVLIVNFWSCTYVGSYVGCIPEVEFFLRTILSYRDVSPHFGNLRSTGCPTKNYTLFWRAVAPLNFELGIKVRGALESSGSQLFKTVPTFDF